MNRRQPRTHLFYIYLLLLFISPYPHLSIKKEKKKSHNCKFNWANQKKEKTEKIHVTRLKIPKAITSDIELGPYRREEGQKRHASFVLMGFWLI